MSAIFKKTDSKSSCPKEALDLLLGKIEKIPSLKNVDDIFELTANHLQKIGLNPLISIIDSSKENVYLRYSKLDEELKKLIEIKPKTKISIKDLRYSNLINEKVNYQKNRLSQLKKIFNIYKIPQELENYSSIAVPLVLRNETIGFLEVIGNGLKSSDAENLRIFSDELVIRLANIILFQEVSESEKKYERLFEGAKDGYFILNTRKKKIIESNKKLNEITEYTKNELNQINLAKLFGTDNYKEVEKWINNNIHNDTDDNYILSLKTTILSKSHQIKHVKLSVIQNVSHEEWFIHLEDISKKKLTEDKLRESEKKYRQLVDNANETVLIIDRDGFIKFANNFFYKLTGFTEEETKKLHISSIIHPEDLDSALGNFSKNRTSNKKFATNDFRIITKLGEIKYVSLSSSPLTKDGEYDGVQAIARDVTENKKLLQIIEHSKNHYEQILDTIQDAICVINNKQEIIRCNKIFAEKTNTPITKIIGKKCFEVIPKYENHLFKNHHETLNCGPNCKSKKMAKDCNSNCYTIENYDENKNKHYHQISVYPSKNNKDEIIETVLIIHDITERRTISEKINALNEFNKKILSNVPVSIMTLNKEGIINSVNNYFEKMTNHREYVGKNIYETSFSQKQNLTKKYKELLKFGTSFSKDNCVYFESDSGTARKYLNIIGVPLKNKDGNIEGAISMAIDNTDAINVQEEIERLNKELERKVIMRTKQLNEANRELNNAIELKSKFISDASHELRTPLTIIQGNLELAMLDLDDKEGDMAEMLEIMSKEIDRMTQILSDLTMITSVDSQTEILNYANVDLQELIETVEKSVAVLANQKKIKIKIKKDLRHTIVKGDETRLEKLLLNLARNSIKYTDEGGWLKLWVEKGKSEARIIVEDNGMGIPKDDLPYIFERFYRVDKARSRSEGGTGLGLSICKWIVEAHKGYISIESEVDEGTKITIHLPYDFRVQNIIY